MDGPRVSVFMSVFNDGPYLASAIESILSQTFGDFEFLIMDDGSTDDSRQIIERFAGGDSRIRAFHQSNRGLISSLNTLVGEARAPIMARMDGDDISLPSRLEQQLAYLDAHPEIGVLGTGAITINERGEPGRERFDNVTTPEAAVADLKNGPPLCHPSVMMRRSALESVGCYHPAFLHCEDYDLWLRISAITGMTSLPERLILYRQSASQVSFRHTLIQQVGAAIAWEAHIERLAGRIDPTEHLASLPPITELDALFARPGVTRSVREKVVRQIVFSPIAMRGGGFTLLLDHMAEGGRPSRIWRTVARLATFGLPFRALRLVGALAMSRLRRPSSKSQLAI
jgi:hypothetical protein